MKIYPAIFHKENGYWVEFPDLTGCVTEGDSLEEAMSMAQEALGLWLVSQIEMGNDLPKASDISEIHADDGIVTYVATDVDMYAAKNRQTMQSTFALANVPIDEPDPEEAAIFEAYRNGDPEYQPPISHDDLMKELGL